MEADDGYRAFVAARYGSLVRAAVLLGCRPADTEDAAQDALARCFGAWSRVRAADDPEAYAYRVLVNGIARSRRRRWRGEVPHAEPPETPHDPDAETALLRRAVVERALERLGREPARCRATSPTCPRGAPPPCSGCRQAPSRAAPPAPWPCSPPTRASPTC